jgi:hypothetical protein
MMLFLLKLLFIGWSLGIIYFLFLTIQYFWESISHLLFAIIFFILLFGGIFLIWS